jgi:hypothetical protein
LKDTLIKFFLENTEMAAGSWLRFIIGLLLSVEVVRLWIGGSVSALAMVLAVIFILLVVTYAVFRF